MNTAKTTPQNNDHDTRDVRFLELRAEPWADVNRIRVHVTLTPIEERPNLEAWVMDEKEDIISNVNIIELTDEKFVFTMHLKEQDISGDYKLKAKLFYPENDVVDEKTVDFTIPK